MQAAMMRLGTLVYLYGGGAQTGIQVWTERQKRLVFPIRDPATSAGLMYTDVVREHVF